MARTQNFKVTRGEATTLEVTLEGSGSIAGQAFQWDVVADLNDATATISKTTASGITITDPVARTLKIALASADTVALEGVGTEPWRGYNALARTDLGAETVYFAGRFVVENVATIYP